MKQTAKIGCRVLIALLCLAMLVSVINIPAFAAEPNVPSTLTGSDLTFLMNMLQQYNKVKDDEDAAEQMKEYVEKQYESDKDFKESADSLLGSSDTAEGEQNNTLDNMNTVIDNMFTEEFTITWVANGETVSEEVYKYGETPVKPADPADYEDDDFYYTFEGWTPVVVAVKGAATYTAIYSATEKNPVEDGYTVTFVTGNGKVVKTFASVEEITAANINTDKAADNHYEYKFDTWTVEVDEEAHTQTWTAVYTKTEVAKDWNDILTSGKVIEDYFGSMDNVMDAVQNGASVDDLKDSIQHQQREEQNKAEAEEKGEEYVPATYTVTWVLDGTEVAAQTYTYKQLIQQPKVDAISAGKYVSWDMEYVLVPDKDITIKGETVDIVEEIVADVNGLPMNYGEYRMTFVDGVATLYVNVNARNYNEILRDLLGDVNSGNAQSAYKEAVMAFLQSSAMHMYSSKTNTIEVNGHEVFGIDGYSASQLVELLETVQEGKYGEIVSVEGLKQALTSDPVTPTDIENMGDDGVIATYDITLGANGKQDYNVKLNVALDGNLTAIRAAAKSLHTVYDFAVSTNGDMHVEITIPAAFTTTLTKALNHARVSDQTKKTIVEGLSECATVGELLALFDLLEYNQFVEVVEYMLDHVSAAAETEKALIEKIEALRPAFELTKKFGNILIDKVPESVSGKEASVTFKSIYNLTQMVTYDDLAALTQYKDADALVGSARLNEVVARVANKLNVSEDRAQDIVMSMVEAFADYQNRIPDSAKAQSAFAYTNKAIDLVYNLIPEKFQDAKLTDTYKGDGEFSYGFSKTYNPTAWLKNLLDKVSITAYGRTFVVGSLVPTGNVTSDISFTVNVTDLYSVTYVADDKVVFEGFLPYGANVAPYGMDAEKAGYGLTWVDEYGYEVETMPGEDIVLYAQYTADMHTITFKVLDEVYVREFAYGTVPALEEELYNFNTLNFTGWKGYGYELPAVTGDATYEAEYTATITFDILGTEHTTEVAYGEVPTWDESLTEITDLRFAGWEGFGLELPAATAHATYKAEFYANITFIVEGVETTEEFKVGTDIVVANPSKAFDYDYRYEFAGWKDLADGTIGLKTVSGPATYEATFDAVSHFGEGFDVERDGNVYTIRFGNVITSEYRLTVSGTIPSVMFTLAEWDNNVVLKIAVSQDAISNHNVPAMSVLFDNAAIASLKDNKTGDEIVMGMSVLLGEEPEWSETTPANYYDYDEVYSFDLEGTSFTEEDEGIASITVPFASTLKGKYYASVDYAGAAVETMLEKAKNADELVFNTTHFSYYAVSYDQYLFTVTFVDVNGNVIGDPVEINTDLGQTLTEENVPAFTVVENPVTVERHIVSFWSTAAQPNASYNPVQQFNTNPADYTFVEKQVEHTFSGYAHNDTHHWLWCELCQAQFLYEEHTIVDGECFCGYKVTEVPEETTTSGTDPEVTTPEGTDPEETTTSGTDPEVTTPGETTGPDDTTPEGSTDGGTEAPSTEETTDVPSGVTSDEETSAPEEESTDEVVPGGNKNGWWIFLIVLLVIIAILIIAYILYGHNIFPKGPAAEEQATEEENGSEQVELTDEQILAAADQPVEEIHLVDHVAANEVDSLMTDAQAVSSVELVASSATGKMGAVNVGTLNDHFETGDKVDIEVLKEKKLIDADCKRVKILADGDLDKALVVEANSFSLQAIKMITLTGGHAIKLQANPADEAPAQDAPVEEAVAEETVAEDIFEEAPVEETVEEAPAEETVEEAPAEETVEEAPAEETVEEAPVEETVEEAPAEETVEEAPAEETVEEAPAEETTEETDAE